ncbi:MAG: DUF2442 domain-containing protein [Anaerolineae bacterium]|nr:DUF2442 domain-containing protein [Anaerolineae bacterium]
MKVNDPFQFEEKGRPVAIHIDDDLVSVTLADGRIISNPLTWHPWLANATAAQQAHVEFHAFSVDFPDLDEGLDIHGMLMGIHPPSRILE